MAGVDVGQQAGIFTAENIDVTISTFRGDGQIQQALTAGAIDIGFGSGPGMGYASKGVPAHAVAVMANPPFFDDPETLRGPAPARAGAYRRARRTTPALQHRDA